MKKQKNDGVQLPAPPRAPARRRLYHQDFFRCLFGAIYSLGEKEIPNSDMYAIFEAFEHVYSLLEELAKKHGFEVDFRIVLDIHGYSATAERGVNQLLADGFIYTQFPHPESYVNRAGKARWQNALKDSLLSQDQWRELASEWKDILQKKRSERRGRR